MRLCSQCNQQNQADSKFCYQCGTNLSATIDPPAVFPRIESNHADELWRDFIGPHADRYLTQFKKFGPERAPKFALTWNWPAFLFVSFLWFLYRKMYVYAMVYAIGPMISTYLTGDITVGIVWSIMAGATGNYIYYWHCREQIGDITRKAGGDQAKRDRGLKEAGGVQPYVIWVGVAFYVVFVMMMFRMIEEGLDGERPPSKPARTMSTYLQSDRDRCQPIHA